MTEEEIEKLATLIVSKIAQKQEEYDAEFLKNFEENEGVAQFYFGQKPVKSNKEIIEENIASLEDQLSAAFEAEDYMLVQKLNNQIKKLKDKL